MATEQKAPVHPGDIVQDAYGCLYLVSETHRWGVGAIQRWLEAGDWRETYSRLKPGQFVVVGTAHTMPEEVAQRRRASVATARVVEKETGK